MPTLFFSFSRLIFGPGIVFLAAAAFHTSALGQTPEFEARFNDATSVDLQNGAMLGPGVSGQPDDQSYTADASKAVDAKRGPMALSAANNPVTGIEEFTITVWFKPLGAIANDVTLFELLGTVLIWEEKTAQWVLRIDTKPASDPKPSSYWFHAGGAAPLGTWATPNEWNYLAMVWKKTGKKVVFYQGSSTTPVTVGPEVICRQAVEPLSERRDAKRVVGNCSGAKNRPFSGSIDDFRFYTKALDPDAIEKIRLADLKNKAPVLP